MAMDPSFFIFFGRLKRPILKAEALESGKLGAHVPIIKALFSLAQNLIFLKIFYHIKSCLHEAL